MLGRLLRLFGPRAGLEWERVAADAWLVRRRRRGDSARSGLRVRELDGDSWLVERSRRRRQRIRQIGPPELRTTLLFSPRRARREPHRFQRGMMDLLAREQLLWSLRGLGVNCVLDGGANLGQFAQMLRAEGYTGRIVSYEPLSELVAELRRLSADDPDWHVVGCALGEEPAQAEINVVPGKMSSLLDASSFGKDWSQRLREPHRETVDVRRLDALLDEAVAGIDRPRVFLKLDTQGFDLPAFRGLGERVTEVVGLQSEVSCVPIYDGMARLPEQLGEYEAAGFELAGVFPVSRHVATQRVIEMDVVMVRASAFDGDAEDTDGGRGGR